MRIVVTGGAGFIGSHVARELIRAGHEVWCYDNLSSGHRRAVMAGRLIVGDLANRSEVEAALREYRIEAVMHLAAVAAVGESFVDPAKHYQNNVVATLSLFEAMRASGVCRIVFSSTTALYGAPLRVPITEETLLQPISHYGFGKLDIERALAEYDRAYGFGFAALRYFNAARASPHGDLGEDHARETHLIPLVLQVAIGQRDSITIFGHDYPKPDRTCARDYIHVHDLAIAHVNALERLTLGEILEFNLGTSRGHGVHQVIKTCRRITRRAIPVKVGPRRPGDPPQLIADASRARHELAWAPRYQELDEIVETAWRWHRTHPQGFGK